MPIDDTQPPDSERGQVSQYAPQVETQADQVSPARLGTRAKPIILLLVYALGLGSGYLLWGRAPISPLVTTSPTAAPSPAGDANAALEPSSGEQVATTRQIRLQGGPQWLPDGYTLPVAYGDIGPRLLQAGAIEPGRFVQVYKQAGQPLSEAQLAILSQGSDRPITIDRDNAYFLLNFFWALGLANQNSVLTEGSMMQYGEEDIGRFASTAGWTIGAKPATELYASTPLIPLTPEQQARLEEVAAAVYRPCCDNPTAFPDCNHGMAMLGLLELMAAQDASVDEMFEAARYANIFWFPQQSLEMALFFEAARHQDLTAVDAREVVGRNFSSGSGFQALHQWLGEKGLLPQAPNGGSSCGV